VGRLTAEKGVTELLDVWPRDMSLDVYGSGPLLSRVEAKAGANVRVRGEAKRDALRRAMPEYEGLVLPSRWFEGLPTVVIEALAAALPVVALEGSGVAELIDESGSGIVVGHEADRATWADALAVVSASRATISGRARALYEDRFTPSTWLRNITDMYETLDLPHRVLR
jgi:glycosyltransferase involved in cell wall biosynthesis